MDLKDKNQNRGVSNKSYHFVFIMYDYIRVKFRA